MSDRYRHTDPDGDILDAGVNNSFGPTVVLGITDADDERLNAVRLTTAEWEALVADVTARLAFVTGPEAADGP